MTRRRTPSRAGRLPGQRRVGGNYYAEEVYWTVDAWQDHIDQEHVQQLVDDVCQHYGVTSKPEIEFRRMRAMLGFYSPDDNRLAFDPRALTVGLVAHECAHMLFDRNPPTYDRPAKYRKSHVNRHLDFSLQLFRRWRSSGQFNDLTQENRAKLREKLVTTPPTNCPEHSPRPPVPIRYEHQFVVDRVEIEHPWWRRLLARLTGKKLPAFIEVARLPSEGPADLKPSTAAASWPSSRGRVAAQPRPALRGVGVPENAGRERLTLLLKSESRALEHAHLQGDRR
jgi:hypothetical protein